MPAPATDPADVAPFHPGRVARVFVRAGRDLVDVALAGELSPSACRAFGLPARSCAFEIDVDALIAHMSVDPIQVKAVSTFPLAKEDIALVVPSDIPAARVEQIVRQGAGPLAESVTLFDIYEGDQVPDGYRSLAFALRLRAADPRLSARRWSLRLPRCLEPRCAPDDAARRPVESHCGPPLIWGVAPADSTGLRFSMWLCTSL